MEIEILHIDRRATQWDVKREIGSLLHGNDFFNPSDRKDRPINFRVELNEGRHGIMHDGTGILRLPSSHDGNKFMKLVYGKGKSIHVNNRKLAFRNPHKRIDRQLSQILQKTPYIPPETEEIREDILNKLEGGIYVDKVQFGVFYRRKEDSPSDSRRFSTEYELKRRDRGAGMLRFEYQHKLIRLTLGDPTLDDDAYNIAITFANIRKLAIGHDSFGIPFICFDLFTPPVFQRERFYRLLTGNEYEDNRKYRHRIDSINPSHAKISPYAHQLRLVLHEQRDVDRFVELCQIAGVQRPHRACVEANAIGFFSDKRLYETRRWLQACEWVIAFQIEAMLRNGLVNTQELFEDLRAPITRLIASTNTVIAADILRIFIDALRTKESTMSALDCFNEVWSPSVKPSRPHLKPGEFLCHHVTVTPSRIVLEGPYALQSNRVIRKYADFNHNFIRVDFRDEDKLHYRWERDVDGKSLLYDRVGGILKNGIEIAGREFEFLAYSSSALREHAVWFVHPFYDHQQRKIDADAIRNDLGDFSGVIKYPSKYAARMAQAFTATDPSVSIPLSCIETIDDLGTPPHIHTDGVGTISAELGDQIWEALCAGRDEGYRKMSVKPSAYQIRVLGYKGVVAVDHRLTGIKMRVRDSMNKFRIPGKEHADIEIARAFERPGVTYLNRPLITILEDRGVDKSAFLKLQNDAIAQIHMASDTMELARKLFRSHSLGTSFGFTYLLQCLAQLEMDMEGGKSRHVLDDPFFHRLILFAKNHVLRDIKHAARIPVPDSYLLVGIADEGAAYEKEGVENVFKLKANEIYVCVQSPDEDPIYLEGNCTISRSPTVHPGDVQLVRAIGKPPDGQPCFFRGLKNVVVLPCPEGERSLASCLGGGDLDGDLYSVIKEGSLLPSEYERPADYEPVGTRELDRPSTIVDVCDFVVEYIHSDVLGLLSDRHLIIADQSRDGTRDPRCIKLANLCSQAVDYPKNGIPVDMEGAPRRLIPFKPDWKKVEDIMPHDSDYYLSTRALGELFRNIQLLPRPEPFAETVKSMATQAKPLSDNISKALIPYIQKHLHRYVNRDNDLVEISPLFHNYAQELRYIRLTHCLSDSSDDKLEEEEVVVGTILAHCTQSRYRTERMHRMRTHTSSIVRNIYNQLYPPKPIEERTDGDRRFGLQRAWQAWDFAMRRRTIPAANSFALTALRVIFNILEEYGDIELKKGPITIREQQADEGYNTDEEEDLYI
ncbi:RdRP-domain-containing protein [Panus rudis PR-1116 ss-1]|nr:RdRP-domain-containing protein [Panus rudis PR-1116 ss-1]